MSRWNDVCFCPLCCSWMSASRPCRETRGISPSRGSSDSDVGMLLCFTTMALYAPPTSMYELQGNSTGFVILL